jgi:hypothetical protein
MAELHEEELEALHWMQELAELLGSNHFPGMAEWQRLTHQPPPQINGNHIWVKPRG